MLLNGVFGLKNKGKFENDIINGFNGVQQRLNRLKYYFCF